MATSSYSSFFPAVTPLKVLILGSGGREHAIAHHLLKDSDPSTLQSVHICPGNGGTGPNSIDPKRCFNLDSVVVKAGNGDGKGDFADIVKWSIDNKINFLIPGPEQPLVDGVEEAFRKVGIPVFGPSPLAAQMEGSKTFSKHFMSKHSIPTADFQSFSSNQVSEAISYIESLGGYSKVVLKASGLAGGKGVLLPESSEEAKQGVEDILVNKVFGSAGSSLLIESRLIGPELSVLVFSDGYKTLSLPGCQDHKRILEGDLGPNTGGMGAYSPAPEGLLNGLPERIQNEIVQPSIDGMRKDGFPFVGLLFIGLMLTPDGPKVLEYNVRFGDPETEAVLDLLEIGNNGEGGANLLEIFKACTERRLDSIKIKLKENVHSVSVVLASKGYPGKYSVGKEIQIQHSKLPKNVNVFHAGTKIQDGKLVTAGGRVLVVTAFGSSLKEACDLAYQGIEFVEFEGKTFRKDIAHRALKLSSEISSSSSSTTTKGKGESMTYSSAGVDVDEGNALVEAIKPLAKSTKRLGCDSNLGGFGGTFDLKPLGFKDPILVSGTDGVGTKLRVALDCGLHDTVGIDLVAMSVNDLLVQGALPLYFLDYFACSTLKLPIAVSVISGIAEGCRQSKCGLIGGETAEMPGMYVGEEYDLAGFAVGAVERSYLLPRLNDLKKSDVLIGLRSSGIHSNGFSLVRKIVKKSGLTFKDPIPFDLEKDQEEVKNFKPKDLGSLLLNPTRIYVEALEEIFKRDPKELGLKALCHITGGGFTDNLPRILPDHLNCKLDLKNWKRPEVFGWLQKVGNVESREMARTFNNGIGMVLAVEKGMEEGLIEMLKSKGERPVVMGEIDERGKGEDQVLYQGFESWE